MAKLSEAELVEYYMAEGCGYLAIALSRLMHWRINILFDEGQTDDFGRGDEAFLVHAFVAQGDMALDASGLRSIAKLKAVYHDLAEPVLTEASETELKSYMGDDRPLQAFSEEEIDAATAFAQKYLRKFMRESNPMGKYKEIPERIFAANPCDSSPTPEQFADYEGMSVQICRGPKPWPKDTKFTGGADVEAFARSVGMIDDVRERFYAIYCDQHNVPQGYRLIGAGGVAEALVDPKILFQPAVALAAPVMFCVHNHPSGDVAPSTMDKQLLKRLFEAGVLVNVRIVDFLVVGVSGVFSFAERDMMPKLRA